MQTQVSTTRAIAYILNALKPFKFSVALMILVAVYSGLTLSLNPYLIKTIINRVAEHPSNDLWPFLLMPVVSYLVIQFFISVGFRLYDYFIPIRMIPVLRSNIVQQATDSLLNQSHNYFQNTFSGSLSNKVNDLGQNIPEILQIFVDRFIFLGLTIIFAIITLSFVNYKFALLMFSWVALFATCVLLNTNKLANLAEVWSEQLSIITGQLVDIFSNILSVRLFSSKNQEQKSLSKSLDVSIVAEKKVSWAYMFIFLFYAVITFLLTAISLYLLINGRQQGYISAGDFALVLMINIALMDQLWMLAKDFAQFSKLLGRITQALNSILVQPEIVDSPNATTLSIFNGTILFDNVHFNYKGQDAIFRNKTVTIEPGQKVGLVGYSGGGKTTFVNLILRLYDVTGGKIFIDGQDISNVTQDSLHDAIGMIPQDPTLFHRSLMDNIRYAKPAATDADVIAAAKSAHADEFIVKLPQGYNSLVGERGIKLSGGQRQRIAIARAMLKNAPILILDEATSQLDSVTEGFIQDSLWDLMQHKTTIVIAHRLSTLLHMDRILVFDQGKIVEDGTHQELLARVGLYKTLWDAQVGGFLPSSNGD